MRNTSISWTQDSWNVTNGCSREMAEGAEQSGCGDPTGGGCYAERMAYRFSGPGGFYEGLVRMTPNGPRWTGKLRLEVDRLDEPLRWRDPRYVFVCSTSDPFHPKLKNDEIAAIYGVMAAARRQTFQMLTKRARRRREWFAWLAEVCKYENGGRGVSPAAYCFAMAQKYSDSKLLRRGDVVDAGLTASWPLPNVWEGASVENMAAAESRVPDLLATPAALRWLSIEPQLEHIRMREEWMLGKFVECPDETNDEATDPCNGCPAIPNDGKVSGDYCGAIRGARIDWIVNGCESGPGARAAKADWYRTLRDQCAQYGVLYFLKQAEHTPGEFIPIDALGRKCSATLAIGAGDKSDTKGPGPTPDARIIERPMLDGQYHLEMPSRYAA